MRTEFKLITPDQARNMITSFSSNRNLNKYRIKTYAEAMKNGEWFPETGESIKISKSGKMIDGNHRCHAVIEANIPIYFSVIYDIPDEAMPFLDTGHARTAADVFTINGISSGTRLTSIIQAYYRYRQNIFHTSVDKSRVLSNKLVLDIYNNDRDHWNTILHQCNTWYTDFYSCLKQSTIGGLYCYLSDIDAEKSYEFMNQLCTGKSIKNNSIQLLRDKLIYEKTQQKKTSLVIKLAFIFKTWNAFRLNKEIKLLKWNATDEKFPIAI